MREKRVPKRQLVGRKIVNVEWTRLRTNYGTTIYEPTITLDDGAQLMFMPVETEDLEGGVSMMRVKR